MLNVFLQIMTILFNSNTVFYMCSENPFVLFLFLPLKPVGFVTFDSRSGAEAAKSALNVSKCSFSLSK